MQVEHAVNKPDFEIGIYTLADIGPDPLTGKVAKRSTAFEGNY